MGGIKRKVGKGLGERHASKDDGELLYLRPVITVKIIRITIYMYLRRYGEWVRVK